MKKHLSAARATMVVAAVMLLAFAAPVCTVPGHAAAEMKGTLTVT